LFFVSGVVVAVDDPGSPSEEKPMSNISELLVQSDLPRVLVGSVQPGDRFLQSQYAAPVEVRAVHVRPVSIYGAPARRAAVITASDPFAGEVSYIHPEWCPIIVLPLAWPLHVAIIAVAETHEIRQAYKQVAGRCVSRYCGARAETAHDRCPGLIPLDLSAGESVSCGCPCGCATRAR
jgi:hypothetical protein